MASAAVPQSIGGFSLTKDKFRPRMVISIAGLDKSGKTHFALTSPGDLAYANLDTGLEGVVHKFEKDKRVYRQDYRIAIPPGVTAPQEVANIANGVWEQLKKDVREAYKSKNVRSVVIDPESEIWEMIRLARFGKLTQVMPHHYGPVNTEYRNFINEVYDTDKNLILLGRLKEEWENTIAIVNGQAKEVGKKTGKLVREGQKDIPFLVQINAIARYDVSAPRELGKFSIEIVNCRQNDALCGAILPQSMCNFASIGQLVWPETTEDDWK